MVTRSCDDGGLLVAILALFLIVVSNGRNTKPLPPRQQDFFDLLPVEFPGDVPAKSSLDEVGRRLAFACSSAKRMAALAIASSELHSMTFRENEYDLTLPDFDGTLDSTEWSILQRACQSISQVYSWFEAFALEASLLCPRNCQINDEIGEAHLRDRASHQCRSWRLKWHHELGPYADLGVFTASESWTVGRGFVHVSRRVTARSRVVGESWCRQQADIFTTQPRHLTAQFAAKAIAREARIFLDHAFYEFSLGEAGFAAIADPFKIILRSETAPVFRHFPVVGQRWEVMRALLASLSVRSESGHNGLRVAEIGVEKGMTAAYLLRHVSNIEEYVMVDPWYIPGKSPDFNSMLDGYYQNILTWSLSEPSFRRGNSSVVKILRTTSDVAVAAFDDGYFDAVFIDAEHTFLETQRDIAAWKRRVRRDGGAVAGHDFSIFHPAVALAVLFECGAPFPSEDGELFPVESEKNRNVLNLAVDSVWWCTRAL